MSNDTGCTHEGCTHDATGNEELFEKVWDNAVATIESLTPDTQEHRFLKSIVMGGTVAAETLVASSHSMLHLWNKGSIKLASELSLLFSLTMLSQIYRWVNDNPPENFKGTMPKEVVATQIIHVYNGNPEVALEDFFHFDKQFSYDLEKHQHLTHISCLLLARCCEICGHKSINWQKVKWPVVELTHLVKDAIIDRSIIRNKADSDAVVHSLNAGSHAMVTYYGGG